MIKTALVTGGARGIGKAVCAALSREGWRVVINFNKSEAEARALAQALEAEVFQADVSDTAAVKAMFGRFPDISLLVNNAGIAHYGLFHETPDEEARRLFDVNLHGASNCIRAALPGMLREKSGCIVNISSVWGVKGASMEAAYSASKAAIIGLTLALSKEYGPSGIRVNCVAPGAVNTDMLAGFSEEELRELASRAALGRLGAPEDVAQAVCFLASDRASFITGQVLGVDGG